MSRAQHTPTIPATVPLRVRRLLLAISIGLWLGTPQTALAQEPPSSEPRPEHEGPERRVTPPRREGESFVPAGSAQQRRLTPNPRGDGTRGSELAVFERKVPLRYGAASGQLSVPQALAVASLPRSFLVSDARAGGNKILSVDRLGQPLGDYRSLRYPAGLALTDDAIFVADMGAGRVSMLDRSGKIRRAYGEGELLSPRDVALAPDGSLLVADARGRRLVRIDLESGTIESVIESGAQGDFGEALTVAVGADGQIAGFFRGKDAHLFLIGSDGERREIYRGSFERATPRHFEGLVFDPEGNLYAADSKQGEVVMFDARGAIAHIFPNSRRGGRLSRPVDVDFTGGRLFILDAQAFAIWSFRIGS